MSWLLEDPTPTLVAVVLIVAVLTIALIKTGRGSFLLAIAGVALLGGALLVLEWLVVTDRETVEETLSAAAKALEANDAQALSAYIAAESPMRREVAQEMSRVTINKASWSRLEVKFNRYTNPPSAVADFMGYINAKDRRGEMPYENFAGRFVVQLRKENDRWVMTGYEMPGRR